MPPKICLIVDDEPSLRGMVRTILELHEFQVIEAENGIQAASIVDKLGDTIDLVVTDIQMPGGDGITFASTVRESFPFLPIILVSGYLSSAWKTYPTTAFEFVPKPFLPATLLAAITKANEAMALRKRATNPK